MEKKVARILRKIRGVRGLSEDEKILFARSLSPPAWTNGGACTKTFSARTTYSRAPAGKNTVLSNWRERLAVLSIRELPRHWNPNPFESGDGVKTGAVVVIGIAIAVADLIQRHCRNGGAGNDGSTGLLPVASENSLRYAPGEGCIRVSRQRIDTGHAAHGLFRSRLISSISGLKVKEQSCRK